MENQPDTTVPKVKGMNPVLQTGMYVLALGAGVATFSFKVWDQFYSKLKHTDLIRGLSDDRYAKLNEVYKASETKGISSDEYTQKIGEIEKEYSKNVNKVLKESIGIETEGMGAIKGTVQRFKALGPYTKVNIAGTALIATGTTLGAYFLLNQNAKLKHAMKTVHDKLDGGPHQQR